MWQTESPAAMLLWEFSPWARSTFSPWNLVSPRTISSFAGKSSRRETCVSLIYRAKLEIVRGETKFHGENVDGAHGENSQSSIAAGDSVCHMIHRSVTASCNHASKTFLSGTSGEPFRFASMRGDADRPTADD